MAQNLFSVPIFFIVFRETLEAAIIVSVLLGLAEQIIHDDPGRIGVPKKHESTEGSDNVAITGGEADLSDEVHRRRLVRKLRVQVCKVHHHRLPLGLNCTQDLSRCWFGAINRLGYWRCVRHLASKQLDASQSEKLHRRMVHPSLGSLGKIRRALGKYVFRMLTNFSEYSCFQGVFELIAALMIFVMGITMLKMDKGDFQLLRPSILLLAYS